MDDEITKSPFNPPGTELFPGPSARIAGEVYGINLESQLEIYRILLVQGNIASWNLVIRLTFFKKILNDVV